MPRVEKMKYLVERVGGLIDEHVEKFLRQVSLKQEICKLDIEMKNLDIKIHKVAEKMERVFL